MRNTACQEATNTVTSKYYFYPATRVTQLVRNSVRAPQEEIVDQILGQFIRRRLPPSYGWVRTTLGTLWGLRGWGHGRVAAPWAEHASV